MGNTSKSQISISVPYLHSSSHRQKMTLKLPFLITSTLLWLYWMKVPDVATSYCSVTCHRFQRTERTALYEFVTYSETVDKWLSLASFVATDQRPIGIGKTYKVIMDQTILHFNITDHIAGEHIALEAPKNVLHPRLELWFFTNSPTICDRTSATDDGSGSLRVTAPRQSPLSSSSSSSSSSCGVVELQPQTNHDYGTRQDPVGWCGTATADRTANVISGGVKHHRHRRHQHHHHHHHHRELRQRSRHRSSLELRFYFKHNSFLFQRTLGSLMRHVLQRQFRRSLRHLELILNNMNGYRIGE
ncbi:uncharacterized protein LOC131686774 isoform X2 [Topomyia yanbarensis]|uniref:uncharacterized protein LOC131686774 isoform X2 n=1 Tax=Topomyia yanbarensis TaxID=2498891 RepID=UPI00273AC43B|nr:uncharacterized protein LOC131686774 isoform X2 [Topomyia yanbarensis]